MAGDRVDIFFNHIVTGFEKMDFGFRHVALISQRTFGLKNRIVLTPDRKKRRLMLAQVLMPFRVQGRIAPVIKKECHLYIDIAGTIDAGLIEQDRIRADVFRIAHACEELMLQRLGA